MGTLNDCYWPAETRRERLDGGAWFHWSEPLTTRPPGFTLHSLHAFRFLSLTQMEQIRSRTSESEVWSWFSQTIESGEVHLGVPEIDNRIWIKRGERDNQSCLLYDDIEVMWSYTLFEITDYWIYGTKVAIERSHADTRCTGGMAPPGTIPSNIQRYRIKQRHARVTMLNEISTQPRRSRHAQMLLQKSTYKSTP